MFNNPERKKRQTIVVLLMAWGSVLFYSGWAIRGWQSQVPAPKPPATSDFETHVVLENGSLMPCHIEISQYMLRMWIELEGQTIIKVEEPFCLNQADGVSRPRRPYFVRGIGETGQPFSMLQSVYRTFPAALEFDLTWKAIETDLELEVSHRLLAQVGCQGSKPISEEATLKWSLEPYNPAEFFKKMETDESSR
jgi:hypothetical protein